MKILDYYKKELVKQLEMKQKNKNEDFLVLDTLGASLSGNMLAGKGVIRAGKGTTTVGYGSKKSSLKKNFLTPPHPSTNFEKR